MFGDSVLSKNSVKKKDTSVQLALKFCIQSPAPGHRLQDGEHINNC